MESGGAEVDAGGSSSSGGGTTGTTGSRWNPTKEQISMLENLYNQGVRTPNADQIQQITSKLRAYGQIEGKNVFYWFQNHKARQRQRQKLDQQNAAFLNRFLHHVPHPPLCQNAVCAPYYLPQSEIGFYPQHPSVLVPGPISPRTETVGPIGMPRVYDGLPTYDPFQQRIPDYGYCNANNRKTLDLFPQHPTGTNWERKAASADRYPDASFGSSDNGGVGRAGNQQYFDFFTSGHGSRVSD